jgi:hypothetical protein
MSKGIKIRAKAASEDRGTFLGLLMEFIVWGLAVAVGLGLILGVGSLFEGFRLGM